MDDTPRKLVAVGVTLVTGSFHRLECKSIHHDGVGFSLHRTESSWHDNGNKLFFFPYSAVLMCEYYYDI